MDTSTIESLLKEVADLNRRYQEKAKETGELFNIFSILGVESRETSTHSAFLVELLNPKGSHGRGGLFLDLFISMLMECFPDASFPEFDMESAVVEKERHLGIISTDSTQGGRADIVLKGRNGVVCIENKIYAGDQENQLIRYREYYKGKNDRILYLNLDGTEPSDVSIRTSKKKLEEGSDFHVISYSRHILDWLVSCQNEVIGILALYEAIGQYIQLIKKLTEQDMGKQQQQEFVQLITRNAEFIEGAYQIHCNWDKIRMELFRGFAVKVESGLKHWFVHTEDSGGFGLKDSGFYITAESWNYEIGFTVNSSSSRAVAIGVRPKNERIKSYSGEVIAEKLNSISVGKDWDTKNWSWLRDCTKEWDGIAWSEISTKGADFVVSIIDEIIKRLASNEEMLKS